jgi:flagellar hook protein FlgE
MSLFAALTTAVGGLNAQSNAIGNVADNVANAQTVGFKRIDTNFQNLVTQSNLSLNDPGGVRASPFYQNSLQGGLLQSQSSTALAVSGQGFFNVQLPVVAADGTTSFSGQILYTRQGDFNLNRNGYLQNSSGFILSGWSIDSAGVVDSSQIVPVAVSQLLDQPVASSTIEFGANLPAGAANNTVFSESSVQIFDALGDSHTFRLQWTKDSTNTWFLDVTPDEANVPGSTPFITTYSGASITSGSAIGTQRLEFTFGDGSPTPAGTIEAIDGGAGSFFTITADAPPDHAATVSFQLDFPGAGTQTVSLDLGTYGSPNGVTQYDATDLAVTELEQNGIPRGSFQSLSIDEDGFISLNYDNGSSRALYQIPLTQFNSPNSLQRLSGGAFQRTQESGTPKVNPPGLLGNGKIASNALEGANVDIADEFTKMIQAQRIYSANARTITTADNMLQDVINIIR